MTVTPPRSRRGRQAEGKANDLRILEAARAVFAAQGAGAPVSEIAQRAGIGIGGLYRRYGSKEDLLRLVCLTAMQQTVEAARTAIEADDPWLGLTQYMRDCVMVGTGALAPLAGTVGVTPELRETARQALQLVDRLVTSAKEAGRLREDATAADIAFLVELLGQRQARASTPDERAWLQRSLTIALDGLERTSTPLPAPAPDSHRYQQRWEPTDP